jgi:hypothetical protein
MFVLGDHVWHWKFGNGTVIKVYGIMITVLFDQSKEQKTIHEGSVEKI